MFEVQGPGFRINFMLGGNEDPQAISNVDAVITMSSGKKWGATILTVNEVERILARWKVSGESAGGLYLRVPDLILVSKPGLDGMTTALLDVILNAQHTSLTPLEAE